MGFVDLVVNVIKLAEARDAESRRIETETGTEEGLELGSDAATANMLAPRPAEAALHAYLQSLPEDVVFKLQTTYYAGEHQDTDPLALHRELMKQNSDKEDAIITLIEKAPLGESLAEGLALMQRAFINLEAPF